MTLKSWLTAGIAGLGLASWVAAADEKQPSEYVELSRLIQQAVVEKAPRRFEDKSDWGRTVPIPPAVRLPRLRRAVVQVDGHDEVPDGVWKRSLIWLDDPAKDIKIRVRDVKQKEPSNFRVQLEATVALHGERERKRWKNGAQLLGLVVQADVLITAELACDVKITFDTSKFPPDVIVEPKVVESRLELKEFDLNRVGNVLVGEPARELGNELKDLLQELLRQREGEVKEYANRALATALKDGKAKIPATDLLKMKEQEKTEK